MDPLDSAKALAKFVSPGNDPKAMSRTLTLMSLGMLALGLHVLWACGYGEALGIEGFARNSQITAIQSSLTQHTGQLKMLEVREVEKNIIDAKSGQCMAAKKSFFNDRLVELKRRYFELTGQNFSAPDCADIQ